jgi:hypothetical protein
LDAAAPLEAGPARRLAARARNAAPSAAASLIGTLAWAAANGLSATVGLLLLRDWQTPASIAQVAAIFVIGSAVSFFPAIWLARFLIRCHRVERRFAAAFLTLAVVTIAATAAVYALQYRSYYAQWHEPVGTITWVFQFVFTGLSAAYQFAVLGLRLFFPLGFLALFGISYWVARMPR